MDLEPFIRAARLPGKALHVAMCLHFEVMVQRKKTVTLNNKLLHDCQVSADSKRRALAALEKAGLIRVERYAHATPDVTWLDERPKPKAVDS